MTEEIWKPVVRFGKVIPGYYVSNLGRVLAKNGKVMEEYRFERTQGGKGAAASVKFSIPSNFFSDYTYCKNSNGRERVNLRIHRLVMDAFRPIDEYPPIPKEDWDKTPESAKKFIRDSVFVDHINDDPFDNRLENLRWVSSVQNSNYRKKQEQAAPEQVKIEYTKTPLERLMT